MNEINDLGLMKDYGQFIMSIVLLFYGFLYQYLENQYLEIEE